MTYLVEIGLIQPITKWEISIDDFPGDYLGNFPGDYLGDYPRDITGITADGGQEVVGNREFRFRQACFPTMPDHVTGPCAHALDVSGEIQRLDRERISWDLDRSGEEHFQCKRIGEIEEVNFLIDFVKPM